MKKEGRIKVQSENIFPVIKKWLYSDKDIFLRELVSNASDAIKKYERLIALGEISDENIKGRIDVILDKENKILKISDNGIGMTEDEVEKYITQIAFSGAEDFIEKYKDKADAKDGIIGHFGLGFYSAFMVADSVEIDTLSYINGAKPVCWKSDGSTAYEIADGSRTTRGTDIILHISDQEAEFLDKFRISEMLRKYCHFMPYEIFFKVLGDEKAKEDNEEKCINITSPLWLKSPKDCTEEEYKEFYRDTFLDFNPPLFWIHLNVDYPFNLKGILYFPRQNNSLEVMPGEIKLFSNQVYIADNIKEVVPEFLMLLKGVIDCPDLPLNVSRSFLQNDGDLIKISKHITKKVSDKLHSVFNNDRAEYESYWDDISPFIKFGCIKDEKFYERVRDIILLKTINNEYFTLDEFPKQDDKIFYVTDENVQAQYINMFKQNDMNAALLNHMIDQHFINFMEYKDNSFKFLRIDSDISSNLKTENSEENNDKLIEKFKGSVENKDLVVKAEHLKSENIPAVILLSEQERRMQEMSAMYGNMFNNVKPTTTIVLNLENKVIKAINDMQDEKCKIVCENILDLAIMSHRSLNKDEMERFINRSVEILGMI